jgi:hypothetical protein
MVLVHLVQGWCQNGLVPRGVVSQGGRVRKHLSIDRQLAQVFMKQEPFCIHVQQPHQLAPSFSSCAAKALKQQY